jgi:hypothetical protein
VPLVKRHGIPPNTLIYRRFAPPSRFGKGVGG